MSGDTATRSEPAGLEPTQSLDQEELEALRESVRGLCARLWQDAPQAVAASIDQMTMRRFWLTAAEQGWMEFGSPDLLAAAIAVQQELGRLAVPLPVVDVHLVSLVLEAGGRSELLAAVAEGAVRPVIAHGPLHRPGGVVVRHVELADVATHLLVVDESAGSIAWFGLTGAAVSPLPGLPRPTWSEVRPSGDADWIVPLAEHPDLLRVRRLGLAARAMAAVGRTHELALDHAKHRKQFGTVIGAFQAVSHRLVDAEIAITAADGLLAHAEALRGAGSAAWVLATEVYIEFVSTRMADLQFAAHHTLAAIGYFEESEGPWLFRRAHADLAALTAIGRGAGVGTHLVDLGHGLPDRERGAAAAEVYREVLDAFRPWLSGPPSRLHVWDDSARAVLRDRGWIGVGWPAAVGGGGWATDEVQAFSEALAYANPPLGNILMGINSIAPMVIEVGSPELRDVVLAEIRRGDLSVALGYSEPEAGSDLASLRTRAERVEGGWRINGQKMWGTCFPDSRWALVAARTDPDAPRPHAGITLFLVDTESPGIIVSPHTSLAGEVSATTFWDDVFVPDGREVGEVDAGWAALTAALASERVLIGASVMRAHRAFDRLVESIRDDPGVVVPGRRPDVHREVGRLAVRLQAARALVDRAVRSVSTGPAWAGSMAKIAASEFAEDLHASAIGLLGPDALYEWGVDGAVGDGLFDDGLRASIMGVIAGGTGDIQRNLVARGLGLPR